MFEHGRNASLFITDVARNALVPCSEVKGTKEGNDDSLVVELVNVPVCTAGERVCVFKCATPR